MRKLFVAAATVAIFALLVTPAFGAPGGGGKTVAKIWVADGTNARTSSYIAGQSMSFGVDPSGVRDRDLYMLWVANVCTQDGVKTYAEYLPVTYSSYRVGQAGPFTLSSVGWTGSPAQCTAFVWKFPDNFTPLAGATVTYGTS